MLPGRLPKQPRNTITGDSSDRIAAISTVQCRPHGSPLFFERKPATQGVVKALLKKSDYVADFETAFRL
jgi:hypothetical protein